MRTRLARARDLEHSEHGEQPCACQTPRVAALATPPLSEPFPVPEYIPTEWLMGPPTWLRDYRAQHGLVVGVNASTGEDMGLRLTVTDEGRVGAYFYERGICLVGGETSDCWMPPPSPTGYAMFHQQDVVTAEGSLVKVGVIGNVGGHASPFGGTVNAQRHYADPDAQLIICRLGDDEIGGWVAGAMVPGLTWGDVALVRRCALSGDWRPMDPQWFKAAGVRPLDPAGYDCVGPTLVNRPGLPLIAKFARTASAPVYLGGMGGVQLEETEMLIHLADGTTMELDATEVAEAVMAHVARTAAPPESETVPPAEDTSDGGVSLVELQATVAEQGAAIEEMRDTLGGVVAFIEDSMNAQAAAIDALATPLPQPAVAIAG